MCAICHAHVENLLKGPAYFKRYFSYQKEEKKIPPKDDRFTTIVDKMRFPLHLVTLEFSLFICNEIEPFLTFFRAEWPLAVFLYEKLKELLTSIMGRLFVLQFF